VENLKVNGTDHDSPWISWDDVASGADIEFLLNSAPRLSWGSKRNVAGPSY